MLACFYPNSHIYFLKLRTGLSWLHAWGFTKPLIFESQRKKTQQHPIDSDKE